MTRAKKATTNPRRKKAARTERHGSAPEAPGGRFGEVVPKSLSVILYLPRTTTRAAQVERLVEEFKSPSKITSAQELVSGTLIPEDKATPYVMFFHLDDVGEGKRPRRYLLHLAYRQRPQTQPPEHISELHRRGWTLERLSGELAALIGDGAVRLFGSYEGRLGFVPTRAKSVLAPPIVLGTGLLECSGVEYTATPEPASSGVSKFRWSRRADGGVNVWLNYEITEAWWPADAWATESARAARYLQELL